MSKVFSSTYFFIYNVKIHTVASTRWMMCQNSEFKWPKVKTCNLFYSLRVYVYEWSEHYPMYPKNEEK